MFRRCIGQCLNRLNLHLPGFNSPSWRETEEELRRAEHIIESIIQRHYQGISIPPPDLRLHVGMRDSKLNFWEKGIHSSSHVLKIFGANPNGPILDWGCGSGRTWLWLLTYPRWSEFYYGCDVDYEAIVWLQAHGCKNVVTCKDMPPLPYPDGFFCGTYAFSVLTHIHPNLHRSWYRELHRILSPGGTAYLTQHGASTVNRRGVPKSTSEQFATNNWAWRAHEGHYKSASMVGEHFTRQSIEGLFTVEQFNDRGYLIQDSYLLHKLECS